jgi:hypothetical protein
MDGGADEPRALPERHERRCRGAVVGAAGLKRAPIVDAERAINGRLIFRPIGEQWHFRSSRRR